MHQVPSRAATVATVAAVAVVALAAGALLTWGPDPRPIREATEAPTSQSPATASVSASATPAERRRTLTDEQLAEMRAAREAVADQAIMRQLRDAAERIAQREPMVTPPPNPADVRPGSNRALGYQLMLEFAYAEDQWPALDALWTRESGWNHLAENPNSGAYGIPQSLPATKMAVVGPDWKTNPETQIRWGLAYIATRYGVPDRAWEHSERVGWY